MFTFSFPLAKGKSTNADCILCIRTPETKKICARGSCVPVNHTLSDQKTKNKITYFKSCVVMCVFVCVGACGGWYTWYDKCLGFPLAQSAIFIIFCWNIYRFIIQVQCLKQKRGRKTGKRPIRRRGGGGGRRRRKDYWHMQ